MLRIALRLRRTADGTTHDGMEGTYRDEQQHQAACFGRTLLTSPRFARVGIMQIMGLSIVVYTHKHGQRSSTCNTCMSSSSSRTTATIRPWRQRRRRQHKHIVVSFFYPSLHSLQFGPLWCVCFSMWATTGSLFHSAGWLCSARCETWCGLWLLCYVQLVVMCTYHYHSSSVAVIWIWDYFACTI